MPVVPNAAILTARAHDQADGRTEDGALGLGAPGRGDVKPRLARADHVASSQRDRCPSAQCYRSGVADLRARIRTVVRRDGRAGTQLFPPVLCVQADFLCHESLTRDSPNPEGRTSRFGWARRVSWRQRRVPGRYSAGARKGECHFFSTQIRRVVCRSFRWRIEERGLRRGCNGHLHGLQQTVVFKFAHRALVRELWSFRPFCTHRDSPTLPTLHFGLRMSLFNRGEAARNRVFLVKVTTPPNVGSPLMAHRRSRPPHGRIVRSQDAVG